MTLRDFVAANLSNTCEKSNDQVPDSRLCVIEVCNPFFVNFIFGNDRSPTQLDTIKTK